MSTLPRLFIPSVVLAAAAAIAGACHRAPTVVATAASPATTTNTDSARAAQARADAAARANAARRDSIARAQVRADSIQRAQAAMRLAADAARQSLLGAVHFDFNEDEIRPAELALLDRKVAILRANPALRIRIEGNADERGSDDFNLALGMRRAAAVQRYLEAHGIGLDRLAISSNGEERPLCPNHEEPCWGENRRGDVVITAGGDRIVPGR